MLLAAEQGVPDEVLRDNRGWTPEEWDATRHGLVERGLVEVDAGDHHGRGGVACRYRGRHRHGGTREPFAALDDQGIRQLVEGLDPLATAIAGSGLIPYPNPMGVPRP